MSLGLYKSATSLSPVVGLPHRTTKHLYISLHFPALFSLSFSSFPSSCTHTNTSTMGLSRPTRIKILLAIDFVFFLVELIVGMYLLTFLMFYKALIVRVRICRRLPCPRCRQFPHAQVSLRTCFLHYKSCMLTHSNSDIMSLIVALYAIKVYPNHNFSSIKSNLSLSTVDCK